METPCYCFLSILNSFNYLESSLVLWIFFMKCSDSYENNFVQNIISIFNYFTIKFYFNVFFVLFHGIWLLLVYILNLYFITYHLLNAFSLIEKLLIKCSTFLLQKKSDLILEKYLLCTGSRYMDNCYKIVVYVSFRVWTVVQNQLLTSLKL